MSSSSSHPELHMYNYEYGNFDRLDYAVASLKADQSGAKCNFYGYAIRCLLAWCGAKIVFVLLCMVQYLYLFFDNLFIGMCSRLTHSGSPSLKMTME